MIFAVLAQVSQTLRTKMSGSSGLLNPRQRCHRSFAIELVTSALLSLGRDLWVFGPESALWPEDNPLRVEWQKLRLSAFRDELLAALPRAPPSLYNRRAQILGEGETLSIGR